MMDKAMHSDCPEKLKMVEKIKIENGLVEKIKN
jgi:hypothetical protein